MRDKRGASCPPPHPATTALRYARSMWDLTFAQVSGDPAVICVDRPANSGWSGAWGCAVLFLGATSSISFLADCESLTSAGALLLKLLPCTFTREDMSCVFWSVEGVLGASGVFSRIRAGPCGTDLAEKSVARREAADAMGVDATGKTGIEAENAESHCDFDDLRMGDSPCLLPTSCVVAATPAAAAPA